ncbi:unnamed protein product [Didymodactylos carnosus]|uniref:Uncharacterized protein n=1 Tax=Didymodactylos carnosus TaxID=1234261 RepID=A0A815J1N6_9BILA|nr:unnamed protein product [Didymodactylos carnosus]CAF4261595.1 unnamed protein product [Didymodactylos carnosus]
MQKIAILYNDRKTDWRDQLPFVAFNYNTSIHAITKQIPFEMMFGLPAMLPFNHQDPNVVVSQDPEHLLKLNSITSSSISQARENIVKHQKQYKERYDKNRSNPKYLIKDLVLFRTLNPPIKDDHYEKYQKSLLFKFNRLYHRQNRPRPRQPPPVNEPYVRAEDRLPPTSRLALDLPQADRSSSSLSHYRDRSTSSSNHYKDRPLSSTSYRHRHHKKQTTPIMRRAPNDRRHYPYRAYVFKRHKIHMGDESSAFEAAEFEGTNKKEGE